MRYVNFNGQTALLQNNKLIGWVLLTVNGLWTTTLVGKKTDKVLYRSKHRAMMCLLHSVGDD